MNERIARWLLLAAGLSICVLLLFANKTNLNNQETASVASTLQSTGEQAAPAESAALPPLPPDAQMDQWQKALAEAENAEKERILDSIILSLQSRNRYAYAADYAAQLVAVNGSLQNQERAARLHRLATELAYVQEDSSLLQQYGRQGLEFAEAVLAEDETNEDALLDKGLLIVNAGLSNPMQGILSIRRVLEINPDNVAAGLQLGRFAIQTGQFDKAVERLERVVALEPGLEGAKFDLAYAYQQSGQTEKARPLLESVVAETQDPDIKVAARNLLNSL